MGVRCHNAGRIKIRPHLPASPPENSAFGNKNAFASRTQALNARVAAAARVLTDRGITPTVTRIRAALGGGSPNDLAPALKLWKASFAPAFTGDPQADAPLPVQIADLAHELWQRATVAAAVELKGHVGQRSRLSRSVFDF
jgi:hypothetical protein